jgi:16S rRNA processing protein RimM
MNSFLEIGQIVNTHALRGEVAVNAWTDDPAVFHAFSYVYVRGAQGEIERYEIEGVRVHKGRPLVKLRGIDGIAAAAALKNRVLLTPRAEFPPLPEGRFFIADLIGLQARREDGAALGEIADVLVTGANDVYVVKTPEGKEILLPVTDEVVKEIDVENGFVLIHLIEGLL